ncbi:hypothetical protein ACIXBV_07095 [Bacteroides fragilis]|uniref:hypothetical protein n=1 Tax=Bacteroides fragilis TaxID=817 RepID=UPI001899E271|nr:hypothetical protein [Bacteroides fragilis]MCI6133285.1 hypothetical protein [Parabacteroides distasonis]MCE8901690.1 hypothetical protein [Bacteroides fragilis]MCS2887380.1 hypothetical protein [Bacteroides fragilis]MCZ2513068.1 hypothetical protein [Bacteroides fragilis]MCZ2536678.1 hypothetical protein [Bacteroides fragilis]
MDKQAPFYFYETGPYLTLGINGKEKGHSKPLSPAHLTYWDNESSSRANGSPGLSRPDRGIRIGEHYIAPPCCV